MPIMRAACGNLISKGINKKSCKANNAVFSTDKKLSSLLISDDL